MSPFSPPSPSRQKRKNDLVNHFGNHGTVSWLPFSCAMFEISCPGWADLFLKLEVGDNAAFTFWGKIRWVVSFIYTLGVNAKRIPCLWFNK